MWLELPADVRDRCIVHLKKNLDKDTLANIDKKIKEDPHEWWAKPETIKNIPHSFHFYQGMKIRNLLRDIVLDKELPTGNWDDYYIQAIEQCIKGTFDNGDGSN